MGLSSSTEAKKSSKEVPARPMRESESGERDGPDDLFDAKVGSLSPRIMAVPSPDASSPSSTLYNFTYTPSPPIAIPGSNPRSTYRSMKWSPDQPLPWKDAKKSYFTYEGAKSEDHCEMDELF